LHRDLAGKRRGEFSDPLHHAGCGDLAGRYHDVITRVYASAVAKDLGQPVVVDNRPSESGGQAALHVQNAAPDGYTLLVFSGAQHAALPAIRAAATNL